MSAAKHTPGPWRVFRDQDGLDVYAYTDEALGSQCIAHVFHDSIATRDANASLIAAAPELLSALESVMEWTAEESIPDDRKLALIRNAVRIAIAEATGVAA